MDGVSRSRLRAEQATVFRVRDVARHGFERSADMQRRGLVAAQDAGYPARHAASRVEAEGAEGGTPLAIEVCHLAKLQPVAVFDDDFVAGLDGQRAGAAAGGRVALGIRRQHRQTGKKRPATPSRQDSRDRHQRTLRLPRPASTRPRCSQRTRGNRPWPTARERWVVAPWYPCRGNGTPCSCRP